MVNKTILYLGGGLLAAEATGMTNFTGGQSGVQLPDEIMSGQNQAFGLANSLAQVVNQQAQNMGGDITIPEMGNSGSSELMDGLLMNQLMNQNNNPLSTILGSGNGPGIINQQGPGSNNGNGPGNGPSITATDVARYNMADSGLIGSAIVGAGDTVNWLTETPGNAARFAGDAGSNTGSAIDLLWSGDTYVNGNSMAREGPRQLFGGNGIADIPSVIGDGISGGVNSGGNIIGNAGSNVGNIIPDISFEQTNEGPLTSGSVQDVGRGAVETGSNAVDYVSEGANNYVDDPLGSLETDLGNLNPF